MKYQAQPYAIAVPQRREINETIVSVVRQGLTDDYNLSQEEIYNGYTGKGGLHGLKKEEFPSFHAYTQKKQEREEGQFFTPDNVAQEIMTLIRPKETDVIADLTCGKGTFFNHAPVEEQCHGIEIDADAALICQHIFPQAHIRCANLKDFDLPFPEVDIVVGNPPYNIQFREERTWDPKYERYKEHSISSQHFYCRVAATYLKAGGLIAVVMPGSYLHDLEQHQWMLDELLESFEFLCQYELKPTQFKDTGVQFFRTKVMFWMKKIPDMTLGHPYTPFHFVTVQDASKILSPLFELKTQRWKHLAQHQEKSTGGTFQQDVTKLLFDIGQHPKLNEEYRTATAILEQFYQEQKDGKPDDIDKDTWQKIRLTPTKVRSRLTRLLRKQNVVTPLAFPELVKHTYAIELRLPRSMSHGTLDLPRKVALNLLITNQVPFPWRPFVDNDFPKSFKKYKNDEFQERLRQLNTDILALSKYVHRRRQAYLWQQFQLEDIHDVNDDLSQFLYEWKVYDTSQGGLFRREIKLNDLQRNDLQRFCQKNLVLNQWDTGGGKTLGLLSWVQYLKTQKPIRYVVVTSSSIAINTNWLPIMKMFNLPHTVITCRADMQKIPDVKEGHEPHYILVTFKRLASRRIYKRFQLVLPPDIQEQWEAIPSKRQHRLRHFLRCVAGSPNQAKKKLLAQIRKIPPTLQPFRKWAFAWEKTKDQLVEELHTLSVKIPPLHRDFRAWKRRQGVNHIALLCDESHNLANISTQQFKAYRAAFAAARYKKMATATTLLNSIEELYGQLVCLYNNSANMTSWARTSYLLSSDGDIRSQDNDRYGRPYSAKHGLREFKAVFNPGRTSVFGIEIMDQDVYNIKELLRLAGAFIITRDFEEIRGEALYRPVTIEVPVNGAEWNVHLKIMKEFHSMWHHFNCSNASDRKKNGLKLALQIQLLLKASAIPHFFKEYHDHGGPRWPNKFLEVKDLLTKHDQEPVCIAVLHLSAIAEYVELCNTFFPDRPIWTVEGKTTMKNRFKYVEEFQRSRRGIMIVSQKALSESINIGDVNAVVITALQWNDPKMAQFYGRFRRFTSQHETIVYYLVYQGSIEQNQLALLMAKRRLTDVLRKGYVASKSESLGRFGLTLDFLSACIQKEYDKDKGSYLSWGNQTIH